MARREKISEPPDYILGWTEFLGCRIDLSERPFIPRPETEWWTEQVIRCANESPISDFQFLNKLRTSNSQSRTRLKVLDLCAGSGCIGLAVLKHIPQAVTDFVDIDGRCVMQICRNITLNGINPNRCRVIRSDLFENVFDSYDCILANPPYVALKDSGSDRVARSVLNYEPHRALFAGDDGLAVISRILAEARNYLEPDGFLALEYSPFQKKKIERLASEHQWRTKFYKDQYGRWRWVVAGRPNAEVALPLATKEKG